MRKGWEGSSSSSMEEKQLGLGVGESVEPPPPQAAALAASGGKRKPPFRLVKDDTKPLLRDPILRSDPIETEQAVLRLPPFPQPPHIQSK